MASFGQIRSRSRDAFQSIIVRLYKFALVLTVNEELARALLRSTFKGLNSRKDLSGESATISSRDSGACMLCGTRTPASKSNVSPSRACLRRALLRGRLPGTLDSEIHCKHVLVAESLSLPRLRRRDVLR